MIEGVRAIDCDVHPMPPSMAALAPYLDEFWRDQVAERGITQLDGQSWPVRMEDPRHGGLVDLAITGDVPLGFGQFQSIDVSHVLGKPASEPMRKVA